VKGEHRFAVRTENGAIVASRKLAAGERPRAGEELQQFKVAFSLPSGGSYDRPYADNMNPDSVHEFIRICYEPYRKRFARDFGKTIPGIFTDEPNIFAINAAYHAARLPGRGSYRRVKRRRGYDLLARLPELFSSDPAHFRTRHDYWRTVTELFSEATRANSARGARSTALSSPPYARGTGVRGEIPEGGAAMPSLAHMQRPGIDILKSRSGRR